MTGTCRRGSHLDTRPSIRSTATGMTFSISTVHGSTDKSWQEENLTDDRDEKENRLQRVFLVVVVVVVVVVRLLVLQPMALWRDYWSLGPDSLRQARGGFPRWRHHRRHEGQEVDCAPQPR